MWCIIVPKEGDAFYYNRQVVDVDCRYEDCPYDLDNCYCAIGVINRSDYEKAVRIGGIRNAEVVECYDSEEEAMDRMEEIWNQ